MAVIDHSHPRLTLSPELEQFSTALRGWLSARWDASTLLVEPLPTSAAVRDAWRRLNHELGVAGATVAEAHGGAGGGAAELAIIAEECGRALFVSPLLATIGTAVPLLSGDVTKPERTALLTAIAADAIAVAVAADVADNIAPDDRARLTGCVGPVSDVVEAEILLVAVQVAGTPTLFSVNLAQSGVAVDRFESLDRARSYGTVRLQAAQVVDLGPVGDGLDRARDWARLALAAELVGVSAQALDVAVDYAKQRVQFGRVIGSYQAVKHRCARMLVGVEQARSLVRYAVWCIDNAHRVQAADPPVQTAVLEALWFATATAATATADLIHVLGGTGFTWQHPAHLLFRRARADAAMLGTQIQRREALANRLLCP